MGALVATVLDVPAAVVLCYGPWVIVLHLHDLYG